LVEYHNNLKNQFNMVGYYNHESSSSEPIHVSPLENLGTNSYVTCSQPGNQSDNWDGEPLTNSYSCPIEGYYTEIRNTRFYSSMTG